MRQYTTPEQTAKLIELGLPKPRVDAGVTKWEGYEPICTGSYTLGELIEMLPSHIGWCELNIWHIWHLKRWVICFDPEKYTSAATELIDAAYDLIVKLKEDGVI